MILKMKKITYLFAAFVAAFAMTACDKNVSYADQVKTEKAAINKYIADSAVTVIDEDQFALQNYTTDVSKNQFVLFKSTGIYMQIVNKGVGEKMKDGETATVLCRYTERNLLTDSINASNRYAYYGYFVDKMSVTDNSGSFTGFFDKSSSSLINFYGLSTTAVPKSWLAPLGYINLGRQTSADAEIAQVRIISPHDQGHTTATYNVTPYLYDITYQRGR